MRNGQLERVETVVIGAGQSGLSTGYHLQRRGRPHVILERNARVGDTWRRRWDSLRLFTPARYDGLDGMPFPAPPHSFPTKDEMADYLEGYAARFALPVRTGVAVERLTARDGRLVVATVGGEIEAENVVVAMATFQQPRVPAFARELDAAIRQRHSKDYRDAAQLADGAVLVVGAGNSGAEIALELARAGRRTWLAGRDTGHVPFPIDGAIARMLLPVLFRGVFHRVLTVDTPMGRRVRPAALARGAPLIRVRPAQLAAAGVERVGRVDGVHDGRPRLADGRVLDVANVVWCTGFEPGFSWIDLPDALADGEPVHERGIVPATPGLYFVGLHFLYALSSTMIHGAGRDAERIATAIGARQSAAGVA